MTGVTLSHVAYRALEELADDAFENVQVWSRYVGPAGGQHDPCLGVVCDLPTLVAFVLAVRRLADTLELTPIQSGDELVARQLHAWLGALEDGQVATHRASLYARDGSVFYWLEVRVVD